jgi:hypothetical protein
MWASCSRTIGLASELCAMGIGGRTEHSQHARATAFQARSGIVANGAGTSAYRVKPFENVTLAYLYPKEDHVS